MPWIVVEEGGRYCVHKKNADGSKGETVACHDTEEMAKRQLAALYANEPMMESRAEKTYTAAQREKATTMPDGSFPIDSVADLKRAVAAYGRGNPPPDAARKAAIRRWIIKRARALGAMDQLPEDWRTEQRNMIPLDSPEARSVAFTDLDVTHNGRKFDGYAAVYGQETDLGDWIEVMLPPALRSGLDASPNVPMLMHHNEALPPFATTGAGTLILSEDRRGLRVQAEIDARHFLGPTLMSMMERGEVRGMSIGMITGRGNNKVSERNGRVYRAITGLKKLLDVSPTWDPAYEGTSAELRSLTQAFQQVPVLVPEQIHDGESQSVVDGPDQETTGVVPDISMVCETCGKSPDGDDPCACNANEEPEEQRSGAEVFDENAAAARRRRLRMMGLTLP